MASVPLSLSVLNVDKLADPGVMRVLTADLDGDKSDEVVELIDAHGLLQANVYRHGAGTITANLGAGSGALAWFTGDLDGDGRAEIVQLWNNSGVLGAIVYRWTGSNLALSWANNNVGAGSDAVNWQIGDVDGDGRAELLQLWNNGGKLAVIMYRWTGGGLTVAWSSNDMGTGIGAVSWFLGDVDGDKRADLLQLWNYGGTLATTVYRWTGSGLGISWSSNNMGAGIDALSWLLGDVDGDGIAELVQLWNNGGTLAAILYRWTSGNLKLVWSSNNMGAGAPAIGFVLADVDADGRAELLQLWNNGGKLAVIVYRWTGSSLPIAWSSNDLGVSSSGIKYVAGDVDGDGRKEVVLSASSGGQFTVSLLATPDGQTACSGWNYGTCTSGYTCQKQNKYGWVGRTGANAIARGDIVFKNRKTDPSKYDLVDRFLMAMNQRNMHVGFMGDGIYPNNTITENTLDGSAVTAPSNLDDSRMSSICAAGIFCSLSPGDIRLKWQLLVNGTPGLRTASVSAWNEQPLTFYKPKATAQASADVNAIAGKLSGGITAAGPLLHYSLYSYTDYAAEISNGRSMCSGAVAWGSMASSYPFVTANRKTAVDKKGYAETLYVMLVNYVYRVAAKQSVWGIGLSEDSTRATAIGIAAQVINCFNTGNCDNPTTNGWEVQSPGSCYWSYGNDPYDPSYRGTLLYCPGGTASDKASWPHPFMSDSFTVSPDDEEDQIKGVLAAGAYPTDFDRTPHTANMGDGSWSWNITSSYYACVQNSSPPPACFVAGTPITMADGSTKPIEAVTLGDEVLAYDTERGQAVTSRVVNVFVHPHTKNLVSVDGLVTTPEHRFFVNGDWRPAGRIAAGDVFSMAPEALASGVEGKASHVAVSGAEPFADDVTTYNFEVETYHDYYAAGHLVHNVKAQ